MLMLYLPAFTLEEQETEEEGEPVPFPIQVSNKGGKEMRVNI
jgi:hypothetical protein